MTALVTTVLKADNIRLIAAETCGSAIPTLRRSRPRLLLVDLGLPDGDGLDIARRVREWQDFPHIPIVALTSSSEKAGAAWKAGMDGIIAKPFEIKSFRKMVASWLSTN
jgi:CheY-like chemotaxis protein